MKNKSGLTLIELSIGAILGVVLITCAVLIVVWIGKMQVYFQRRALDDMSWVAANEHIKKQIHGAAYVKITGSTQLDLYNRKGGDPIGTYKNGVAINKTTGLQYKPATGNAIIFENVAATFAAIYTVGDKTMEVKINYTSPSQLASSLIVRCAITSYTWAITVGGKKDEIAYSVQKTTGSNGYIASGFTSSYGAGKKDAYLVKVNLDGVVEWTKTYGSTGDDYANAVQQTSDGGYVFTGRYSPPGVYRYDAWLVKTNSKGAGITVNKRFNPGTLETTEAAGRSIQQTSDGGYVVVGETGPIGAELLAGPLEGMPEWGFCDGHGPFFAYLIRTNSSGVGWTKLIGSKPYDTTGRSIKQTSDLGYIIAGSTSGTDTEGDAYLIKTKSNGTGGWAYPFGAAKVFEAGRSVQITTSTAGAVDGYIMAGLKYVSKAAQNNAYLVRTNTSGKVAGVGWTQTYGGSGNDWAQSIFQTADKGYIFTGGTNSAGTAGLYDVYLVKTNSNGKANAGNGWSKTFGGSKHDLGFSVLEANDGGYIIAGYTSSYGGGGEDMYIIKTDSDGDCPEAKTPTHYSGKP